MGLQQFLDKQEKLKKQMDSKKQAFQDKCRKALEQIKKYNEERHQELASTFTGQYDSLNVKRKKLQGFYAQLRAELKEMKEQAGDSPLQDFSKKAQDVVESAHKGFKTVEKKARENIKKTAKKAEEKTVKKAAKKKTAKKKTAKKTPEKTTKKTAKKKTAKKKTAKKSTEKVTKKAAKKKTTKKASKKTVKKSTKKAK